MEFIDDSEIIGDLLSQAARRICTFGLATPALAFLEMNRPLMGVSHNLAILGHPFFSILFGSKAAALIATLFESDENLDTLIRLIEDYARRESPACEE